MMGLSATILYVEGHMKENFLLFYTKEFLKL